VDRVGRQRVEDFLDEIGGAFFVARFHIEVGNNGEVLGVAPVRRPQPFARVVLVITHARVPDGLK
jgi:hypothetical protein